MRGVIGGEAEEGVEEYVESENSEMESSEREAFGVEG